MFRRKEELGESIQKVTTSEECELVTLKSVIKGRLEVSRGWIGFSDYGIGFENADRERADFKFALSQLQEVHLRRYNLRRSALEFFLTDHTNYFVNFTTKVHASQLTASIFTDCFYCRPVIESTAEF